MIALLLTLARLRQRVLTGILVSMPVISLYTWWWVGTEQGTQALRTSLRAAMWSAAPWVAYLALVYLLVGRVPLWLGLGVGWLTWLALALVCMLALQPKG